MRADSKLELVAISRRFGGLQAVADVSLEVGPGEVVGLMGPNGSGKSTIFNIVAGFLRPDFGSVVIDGLEVSDLPSHARARAGLSYLPQAPSVFRGLTVAQNITLYLEACEPDPARRAERLEALLAQAGLEGQRDQTAAHLSGGQKRRCEIARMLAAKPRYVLMDEPFAGIDPLAIAALQQTIRRLASSGVGVLLSDHNVQDTLAITDRIVVIASGFVVFRGTPAEARGDERARAIWLGTGGMA